MAVKHGLLSKGCQENNSSRDEIYKKNSRIHLDRLQNKFTYCKGSRQTNGIQEELDTTCKQNASWQTTQDNETLFPNWQKESWKTSEETSRYVRPERVNKWPNSMTDIWWWWWWWWWQFGPFVYSSSLYRVTVLFISILQNKIFTILRRAIPVVRLNYMVRWIPSKKIQI